MRESRSAEERADSAVLESLTIAHDLADLYAAGIAPRHAEENNLQSIGKTRSELAATEARIATKLDGATAGRLRRLGEASEALANEVDRLIRSPSDAGSGAESTSAIQARYTDASNALQGLLESLQAHNSRARERNLRFILDRA